MSFFNTNILWCMALGKWFFARLMTSSILLFCFESNSNNLFGLIDYSWNSQIVRNIFIFSTHLYCQAEIGLLLKAKPPKITAVTKIGDEGW